MPKFDSISDTNPFKVRGIIGKFKVIDAKWEIWHFSTIASSNNSSGAGNSQRLLSELKPMRERVTPSEIKDMSSLLQRDLDDSRVANELIPYLLNNKSNIGFFPAVLCALMPKKFLSNEILIGTQQVYPIGELSADNLKRKYGEHWTLETYTGEDNKITAFAQLEVDPSKTDLIVLDGQHRSNAFRFMTKNFPAENDSIHAEFYRGRTQPEEFDAELPVTIIWFERIGNEDLDPKLISRRLFVDVNTNARSVQESRNILLDDKVPSRVCTGIFYSYLAQQSFSSTCLSLLHGAFDSSDDEKKKSNLTIFSPVSIEYAFRHYLLGINDIDNLDRAAAKDMSKNWDNTARLFRFFKSIDSNIRPTVNTTFSDESLRDAIKKTGITYAYDLLNNFNLSKALIDVTNSLNIEINQNQAGWANTTHKSVWEKAYCGGEGLYSSLLNEENDSGTYTKAIKEIENKFQSNLQNHIFGSQSTSIDNGRVKKLYVTYTSKASITALLMAMSKVAEKTSAGWATEVNGNSLRAVDITLNLLNSKSIAEWMAILIDFKAHSVGQELNPLAWPKIRNLYLRVIQDQEAKTESGNKKFQWFANDFTKSPDYHYVMNYVKDLVKSFQVQHGDFSPTKDQIKQFTAQAETELKKVLKAANLDSIKPKGFKWDGVNHSVEINNSGLSTAEVEIALNSTDEFESTEIDSGSEEKN